MKGKSVSKNRSFRSKCKIKSMFNNPSCGNKLKKSKHRNKHALKKLRKR